MNTNIQIVSGKMRRFLSSYKKHIMLSLLAVAVAGPVVYMLIPASIPFAYAGESCVSRIFIAPSIHQTTRDESFSVELKDTISLFGKPIISKKACALPASEPTPGEHVLDIAPFGLSLYKSTLSVQVQEPPEVLVSEIPSPLPTQVPLLIPLSMPDTTFTYHVSTDETSVICDSLASELLCDVESLALSQGQEYQIAFERSFRGISKTPLATTTIETLSATTIVETSIKNEETVFTKPSSIRFKADKPIEEASIRLEQVDDQTRIEVDGAVSIAGNEVVYEFSDELKRNAQFEVLVDGVIATDGSTLNKPYKLSFATSGGPQVEGVNIGTYRVSPGTTAIVTFDQELDDSLDITSIASISGVDARITASGKSIRFELGASDLCNAFTLSLNGDITSKYGVTEPVSWDYRSRLRCHSLSTIGYSVNGSPITAYSFGSGETVLFIGAMHGDERSSGFLMDRFIDDLEANYDSIPQGRRVVVVPRINPDGFSAVSRRNANNVDLNRNFPTTDWKSDVTMPGGTLIKGGGGSEALSEPESRAIADFTLSLRPRLVLTYHAVANNVIANEAGISSSAARTYSELSGYQHVPKSATGEVFAYDTNGAYEDWLYEKQGIAALLVELGSMSYSQFERNKPAMWAMLNL